jgi:hypothetical protein
MTQTPTDNCPPPRDEDANEGDEKRLGPIARALRLPWWSLALVGPTIGRRLRPYTEGDGWTAAFGVGAVASGVAMVIGAVWLQRGTRRPIPWLRVDWVYPLAGVFVGLGFIVAGVGMTFDGLVDLPGDDEAILKPFAIVVAGCVAVALLLQVLSFDKRWPDRWQPPYRRRSRSDDDTQPHDRTRPRDDCSPGEPDPAADRTRAPDAAATVDTRDDLVDRLRL